jgi:hypothetical protein
MPEIKNTFSQGKMNKDLDERLIPNGQYRDAVNIQVTTSEGSDIGTVQNILGNKKLSDILDFVDQDADDPNYNQSGSSNPPVVIAASPATPSQAAVSAQPAFVTNATPAVVTDEPLVTEEPVSDEEAPIDIVN